MKQIIGAQGEITIIKVDEHAESKTQPVEKTSKGFIISHSESGHHHILTGGDVMERTENVPQGMQIINAILENPESLIQDAGTPHDKFDLEAGLYEFRISREYNPFAEEARRVAD